jgi:hypothetical protein
VQAIEISAALQRTLELRDALLDVHVLDVTTVHVACSALERLAHDLHAALGREAAAELPLWHPGIHPTRTTDGG